MAADTPSKEPDAKEPSKKEKSVNVTAQSHLSEAGTRYAPGDTFTVTESRAKALGDTVSPAS